MGTPPHTDNHWKSTFLTTIKTKDNCIKTISWASHEERYMIPVPCLGWVSLPLNSLCSEWIFNYHPHCELKRAALEKQIACQGPLRQGKGVCFEDYFNLPPPLFWKERIKKMTAPLLEMQLQKQINVVVSEDLLLETKSQFFSPSLFCNCNLCYEVML